MSGPSTYVPFFRRFGNERAREIGEVRKLHDYVSRQQAAFGETERSLARRVWAYSPTYPDPIEEALLKALFQLISAETQIWDLPSLDLDRLSMQEFVELRNLLYAKQYFFANQQTLMQLFEEGLVRFTCGPLHELPEMADPTPFTIPLIYALPEPRETVAKIWGTLADYYDKHLFKHVTRRLYTNMCAASGRDPEDTQSRKPLISPGDSTLALDKLVDTYLADTPFHQIFTAPVPLRLTHEERFSHMHILGGTNAGKTTLIENLILHDLRSADSPSLVLIDPHSD
ncbi:MAG: hypothetical protein JSR72_01515, partial [Proteobacteria bacterium]|nr:hypothetical protein [Pseudomonadota bacterium]